MAADRALMSGGGGALTVKARIDEIVDKAKAETGLDEFGGDTWREGLEVLVRSAARQRRRFNDFGEQAFYASLVQPLVNRLRDRGLVRPPPRDR